MEVTVSLYGPFSDSLAQSTVTVELPAGAAVDDLVEALVADYPSLEDELLEDRDGPARLRETVQVTVNRTHVAHLHGQDTPVADGDEVRIFPPVTGG